LTDLTAEAKSAKGESRGYLVIPPPVVSSLRRPTAPSQSTRYNGRDELPVESIDAWHKHYLVYRKRIVLKERFVLPQASRNTLGASFAKVALSIYELTAIKIKTTRPMHILYVSVLWIAKK
jgi:hypothetical protein